jgi:small-conductance mechanosensitive channel
VLLIAGALDQSGILGRLGDIWLRHLAGGALLLIAARAIAAAFYAPEAKRLRLSRMADADATHAYRRSLGLGLALLLQVSFVQAGEAMELSAGTLAVLNLAILIPGAISMWALARLVTPPPAAAPAEAGELGEEDGETIEGMERTLAALGAFLMRAAAGASLLLAAAGYYAASQFALYPLAMSLGLVGAGVLIYTLLREAVEAYLEGRTGAPGGLRLLPVLVGFVIVCLSLPALALIWGARRADLAEAWRLIADGVQLGGVSISPAAFLSFIAVFGLVYGLTRLLQTVMAISVLPNTRLDAGGRSAVTTGLGYAGFVFAALAGIGAAGLDLSSIAIVAGALSVGIGFGLQNIVNNFVSGIILLVERPVKVGDWIFVGGDHGIVKRVAVRATQIETFDKTTLFLPNSELISGKVINYTHQNNAGRLIIRVTAAYGSDPREVERVLTGIARAETRILRYPPPLIMFAGFGDNGMLFEMRVILRDVNLIFDIQSDLYFEVEKGLREAGIEIPMAQRAVHFRGGPGPGSPAPGAAAESAAPPVSAPRPPSRRSEAAEGDPE